MSQSRKTFTALNDKLKHERLLRGWTQGDVAGYIGTDGYTVNRWERGRATPSPLFRQKLCALFGKNAADLGFQKDDDNSSNTQAPFPQIWHVPFHRNPFFLGREDLLRQLYNNFTDSPGTTPVIPQAIYGLGGMGKTQVVLEYAYRYAHLYQAIFWARADSPTTLQADFLLIAETLHLPESKERNQERTITAVKSWLQTHAQWLLILDNIEEFEVIDTFIPTFHAGHILISTRAQSVGTNIHGILLEKMTLEEGALFLLKRAKLLPPHASLQKASRTQRCEAEQLSRLMDGLPLALDQAGAYIEETGCSIADYLQIYADRQMELLSRRGANHFGHTHPVSTTFFLIIEKLEQQSSSAIELLQACAFLHPDAIPEEIFTESTHEFSSQLNTTVSDILLLNEAVKLLRRFSLLYRYADTKVFRIHRIVQTIFKSTLDESEQRGWGERIVRVIDNVFPDVEENVSILPVCQRLFLQVQVCTSLIRRWNISTPEAERLLYKAANYAWMRRVQCEQTVSILHQLLELRAHLRGPEHPDVAECYNNFAVLYHYYGKYAEAESFHKRALALREKAFGPEHPEVAESLRNLARLYIDQSKWELAEALEQRAFTISQKAFGPEHLNVIKSLTQRAIVYREQKRYLEAEQILQHALLLLEKNYETKSLLIALNYYELAKTYTQQERYDESELLFKKALDIYERALGDDHPFVAVVTKNYAALKELKNSRTASLR